MTTHNASAATTAFELVSSTITPDGSIGRDHIYNGAGGGNVSPALRWRNAPAGTLSFAMTLFDPDAPTGSGWWHWVMYDIPATVTQLPAGAGDGTGKALPAGASQTRSDYGTPGYGGPCPPPGDPPHRYIFTVYALKTAKLDVPPDSTAAMIGFMIHFNQLGKAQLTGRYGR